ncbi:MAG: aminodeoxychorismate synthase component I [Bacteroidota bacterium]
MGYKPKRHTREETINLMNLYGSNGTPFLFLISFEGENNCVIKRSVSEREGFYMEMPGFSNHQLFRTPSRPVSMNKLPIGIEQYRHAFDLVTSQIHYGNSFLLNLTFPTEIQINCSLEEIFTRSRAPFKLFLEDELVVFSPERFIRIEGNTITSNPMKGTIDAKIPGAHAKLTSDLKEDAEHNTIVDLIRNDLSIIATSVRVRRFKYIDRVRTHKGELLQMSSEITGSLPDGFEKRLGEMIFSLLPAGSICGAPKLKTLEIIREAEQYKRGYYTGIFGHWDGKGLDSAVAIRYIEKKGDHLFFKSGGGITFQSRCEPEYEEMLNKIYVPIY